MTKSYDTASNVPLRASVRLDGRPSFQSAPKFHFHFARASEDRAEHAMRLLFIGLLTIAERELDPKR